MSDFKAKMHQIRFRLGLRPRPHWGAYSAPPDPIKGPSSKGREGREGKRREGTGREGRGREGKGGDWREGERIAPLSEILNTPLSSSTDLPH